MPYTETKPEFSNGIPKPPKTYYEIARAICKEFDIEYDARAVSFKDFKNWLDRNISSK